MATQDNTENLLRYEMQRGNTYRTALQNFVRLVQRFDSGLSQCGVSTMKKADDDVARLHKEIVDGR